MATPAQQTLGLQVMGALTLLVGCVEFALGLGTYFYLTNVRLGAFWAGVVIIVAGLLGVASVTKPVVIACCVVSVLGVIIGVIGSVVDGIAQGVISDLTTCVGPVTWTDFFSNITQPKVYGQQSYAGLASICALSKQGTDCSCVQGSNNVCFFYEGQTDCNNILTEYPQLLKAITSFDIIATVFVFALSIVTCVCLCCPATEPPVVEEPVDYGPVKGCAHVIPFEYCPHCEAYAKATAAAFEGVEMQCATVPVVEVSAASEVAADAK